MIYIEKHPSEVVPYEQELATNYLDMRSLSDPSVHPTMNGGDVYDQVKSFKEFNNLKSQMLKDQGGICCYCGCRIPHLTGYVQYIVEHVVPKSSNRLLAGEYQNLLLSCRGGLDNVSEAEREVLSATKKVKQKNSHCDKSKGNRLLTYTPLQKDCATHFHFFVDGTIKGTDNKADSDIKVLHLDCDYLNIRRKTAIESFVFDDDNDILTEDELKIVMQGLLERDKNGTFHEYFFVISDAITTLI